MTFQMKPQSTEMSHMPFFGNFIALNGDFGHAYIIGRVVCPLIIITDIVNFVWKTGEGEAESIVLLMFVL